MFLRIKRPPTHSKLTQEQRQQKYRDLYPPQLDSHLLTSHSSFLSFYVITTMTSLLSFYVITTMTFLWSFYVITTMTSLSLVSSTLCTHTPTGRLNLPRCFCTAGAVRTFNPSQSLASIFSRDTSAGPAKN